MGKKRFGKKLKNFNLSEALEKFNEKIPDSFSLEQKQELLTVSFGGLKSIRSKRWIKEMARESLYKY